MTDHSYTYRTFHGRAEALYAQKTEIQETIELFGLNPVLAAQYVCAASLKFHYVKDMRFEEAGRMRDVQREVFEMHTEGQQMVLGVIDISLRQLLPSFSTRR